MKIIDRLNPVLRDIKHYFGFLYERGFEIQYSDVGMIWPINWTVLFKSEQCLIKIFSDRDTIFVAFGAFNAPFDDRLGLGSMIYFLSHGQKLIGMFEGNTRDRRGQLTRLAALLREYMDQITPYFEVTNFPKYRDELLRSRNQYHDILMKRYVPGYRSTYG